MGFCYQKNFFNPTLPVDEAQFFALVRAPKWSEAIDKFRETGDQKLKRGLPAFIFQATFDESQSQTGKVGRWRKQAATRLTGLVVMDIDHVEAHPLPLPKGGVIEHPTPRDYFNVWTQEHPELFSKPLPSGGVGVGSILLIYITPSGKGLKIVFKARPEWGNLIDNQHRMAEILGVEVDESCKDASRMSFICKEKDILYLDKELFTYENKAYGEKYDKEYREGRSQPQTAYSNPIPAVAPTRSLSPREGLSDHPSLSSSSPSLGEGMGVGSFKGIPYSVIIDEWWQRTGGVPQEGERNVRLYQLAVNLRAICDNDKTLLLKVMPRLGLDEQELHNIVESACKETPKGISKKLQEILNRPTPNPIPADAPTRSLSPGEGLSEHPSLSSSSPSLGEGMGVGDPPLDAWGAQIESFFGDYPILRDICKGLKPNQYPAALFVAGGLLMTLMTRCTYRFYHRPEELRRLNNSTFIIGDPASGKSFATRLYKLLSAPIARADMVGKEAINAYRELMRTKGANKEKPKKPKVIVRIHPSRTSNAQFIQDMVNSVEEVDGQPMQQHMLTFDTELDNTITVQRGGSWIDKMSMELKAFHNEEDGQAYSNNDSILQDFIVTWNFIYTGTPIALKKKVNEQNFGSGLATRLTCIPLPATNFEMLTREETVDYESDHRLSHWADLLDRTKGELSVKKLVDELYEWTYRRMMDAKENDSRADEMLLKRCAYHGLNFSVPFIVMRHWDQLHKDGEFYCGNFDTDDTDWRLCELIANIQYACQRHYFGALAEQYFDNKTKEASTNVQHRKKTMESFARLPEEFTNDDVMRCFGLSSDGAIRVKVKRLLDDRLIVKTVDGRQAINGKPRYRKTGALIL